MLRGILHILETGSKLEGPLIKESAFENRELQIVAMVI